MIYDCFLYSGEKEMLEIRVNELYSLNVIHVIVESNYTFRGNRKEVSGIKMSDRIIPVCINGTINTTNAWERESFQRNQIMLGLLDVAKDDDIIIISDADEIPKRKSVLAYTPEMGAAALRMDNFWYKLNCLTGEQDWVGARMLTYKELKETTPNEVRNAGFQTELKDAGWHFSYCGDENFISKKLNSFSHSEYDTPEINDLDRIREKIKNGESLWSNSKFQFVPIDEYFPEYIINNQKRFKHLIQQ